MISNVFETFVCYGLDIERTPLFAVRYPRYRVGMEEEVVVSVYTDEEIITYKPCTMAALRLEKDSREPHCWGEVLVTEYNQGPYVAWMSQVYPVSAENMYATIANAIQWSSNEDYFTLIETFGATEFNTWMAELGCKNTVIEDEWFPSTNARDFAILWNNIYEGFSSGAISSDIQSLYTETVQSALYESLGEKYTVYSKAGWIGEESGTYWNNRRKHWIRCIQALSYRDAARKIAEFFKIF